MIHNFSDKTVKCLRNIARKIKIKNWYDMNRAELEYSIEEYLEQNNKSIDSVLNEDDEGLEFSVSDIANILCCNLMKVRREIEKGKLKAHKDGFYWKIKEKDFIEYMDVSENSDLHIRSIDMLIKEIRNGTIDICSVKQEKEGDCFSVYAKSSNGNVIKVCNLTVKENQGFIEKSILCFLKDINVFDNKRT